MEQPEIKVNHIETKSVMTKSNTPLGGYSVNPYVGCPHACKYCYASFMKRFTGHTEPWGTFMDVKHWPAIKDPKKYAGQKIVIGTVTDGYNPLEETYQNTRKLLTELKDMGLKLGVISNTAALYQVFDSLEEYGIRGFFQDVTLSSVTGFRKPCRDIFTVSLRQMRSRPEECVYVGDTVSRDVIGSKQAGFAAAIQICSRLTREKDLKLEKAPEADYMIEDIFDTARVVRELLKKTV